MESFGAIDGAGQTYTSIKQGVVSGLVRLSVVFRMQESTSSQDYCSSSLRLIDKVFSHHSGFSILIGQSPTRLCSDWLDDSSLMP